MSEVLSLVGSGKNVYGVGQVNGEGDTVNGTFEGGMLLGDHTGSPSLTQYILVLRKSNGGYMGVCLKFNSDGNVSATTCDIPEPTA